MKSFEAEIIRVKVQPFERLIKKRVGKYIDIITMTSNGDTAKDIGQKLGLSSRTVEVHLTNIRSFLNARNTAEMVAIALRKRIIQ